MMNMSCMTLVLRTMILRIGICCVRMSMLFIFSMSDVLKIKVRVIGPDSRGKIEDK